MSEGKKAPVKASKSKSRKPSPKAVIDKAYDDEHAARLKKSESELLEADLLKCRKYCRRASDEGLKSQLKHQEKKGMGSSVYAKELKLEIERRMK